MIRFRLIIVIIAFFCFHEAKSNEFTSPVSLTEWTSVYPDRNRENPDSLKTLNINHAHVTIRAKGSLFYDGEGMSEYFVPADSGTAIIRTASIWIGGYDENNELHVSGEIYNKRDTETAYDYYPGPLMIQGSENPGQCDPLTGSLFNRVWKIDRKDVERILATDPATLSIDNIPKDILEWPAHGPEGYDNTLAPFIDRNGDGVYSALDGDVPEMKGDQMLWKISNDVASPHNETNGNPMY